MTTSIRSVQRADVQDLKIVIETSGLFPSDLLDDMLTDYFDNPATEAIWLTTVQAGKPIAICYCAPERLTEGTYNLYLIAVLRDMQGKGTGGELMRYLEDLLRAQGKRILLVETSGLPEFELTRSFYDKHHYTREAVIRDFYRVGENKVVFWKRL